MAGLLACLAADTTWFMIGRRYGHHVLRILCKLSLEPTVCVRRTQDSFGRNRSVMLLFAKFVPGLATLAAPVAGENGMGLGTFLLFDGMGATIWLAALLTAGRLFGDALKRNPSALELGGAVLGCDSAAGDSWLVCGACVSPADGAAEAGSVPA